MRIGQRPILLPSLITNHSRIQCEIQNKSMIFESSLYS